MKCGDKVKRSNDTNDNNSSNNSYKYWGMAYSIVSCNLHKHLAQTGITDEREKWKKKKEKKKNVAQRN